MKSKAHHSTLNRKCALVPGSNDQTFRDQLVSPASGKHFQYRLFKDGVDMAGKPPLRIVLYSHDTQGLGHTRRNLVIARTLAGSEKHCNVLLITGSSITSSFMMPKGVDCLTMPAIHKTTDGDYQTRSFHLTLDQLTEIRSKIILGAVKAFKPDVMIVDNVPRGANAELDETLMFLHTQGDTRCVLGLRDVLDCPEAVASQWKRRNNAVWIERYYDAVWVYSDPKVLDPVKEYGFSKAIAEKLSFTGYLDRLPGGLPERSSGSIYTNFDPPLGEIVLCLAGGGQDGGMLARAFCEAKFPDGMHAVVLTGPYMPARMKRKLRMFAMSRPHLQVLEFHPEPIQLMIEADHIISMGGYNTVSEILSLQKRALVVPRVKPRREQLIRSERLAALGLIDTLHPDQLSPDEISRWLSQGNQQVQSARELINFNGLQRLQGFLKELVDVPDRVYKSDN